MQVFFRQTVVNKNKIQPDINFANIRALGGKQDKGFEELCVQLFPSLIGEEPKRIVRIEGSGGDGGVEAIATLHAGNHIGVQAKFFSRLDASQWQQIDKSVCTAVDKHPELTRYLICVPLDRTPGQLKKWDQFVIRWRVSKPTLELEWIGKFELLRHLAKPDAAHLLTYWFDCPTFSIEWAKTQTETAITHLHDRYTPHVHQATFTEQRLGTFAATAKASFDHRQLCSNLVVAWRKVMQKLPPAISKSGRAASLEMIEQATNKLLIDMRDGQLVEQTAELIQSLADTEFAAKTLVDKLFPSSAYGDADTDPVPDFYRETNIDFAFDSMSAVSDAVRAFINVQRRRLWVLHGEAGSGKSHLLANLARTLLAENRCCLLLVGERFAETTALAGQIPSLLNWDGSMRELCGCLSTHAALVGKSSLLLIDAINESPPRGLWKRELTQLVTLVEEFPGVHILISCRSDCLESSIPPALTSDVATVEHRGFDLNFHEAVKAYFDGYRVVSPQFPTMNAEFRNPLFLKTLCEAYKDRTLPSGALSFVGVLRAWEDRIAQQIEARIDCPTHATGEAINDIVCALADSSERRIPADTARAICLKHFAVATASQSLYRQLNSSGLLQEIETRDGLRVRLQYERFSDIRTAQTLLQRMASKDEWLSYWKATLLPSITNERGTMEYEARPRLFALALLLPDRFNMELVECPIAASIHKSWEQEQAKSYLWSAWLDALSWRSLTQSEQKVRRYFSLWTVKQGSVRRIWERLFQFSCVPNHPLNADYLHRHLMGLSLPERETHWTIPLATENMTDQTNESVISPFLFWVQASVGKSTDEQVRLGAIVLLWLTSSPNRQLRDLASDVAIRLLVSARSADVCISLLERFWEVNDPYVKERLMAVMSGVVPHLDTGEVTRVAGFIADRFWRQHPIAPHILQREYAAIIIRHAQKTGALSAADTPPMQSETLAPKPKLWTAQQVNFYEEQQGYHATRRSLQPEETGHYGDFGRYVMGTAVHHFADDERFGPPPKGIGRGGREHDARWAKLYIWQRVIELGWTPERYSTYENQIGYRGRMDDNAIERISKKYQWIGLHEYLGLLADSLLFREWNGAERRLHGASELGVRDYDPGSAMRARKRPDDETSDSLAAKIPALKTASSVEERRAWVAEEFPPFEPYLTATIAGQNGLVLYAHIQLDEDVGFGFDKDDSAQKSQWIDVRALLVPNAQLPKYLADLRGLDFHGDGCSLPSTRQCSMVEYPWHPMFAEVDEQCRNNDTWFRELDAGLFFPVCEVSNDAQRTLLPAPTLHRDLGAALGNPLSAPYYDADGSVRIDDASGNCIFKATADSTEQLVVSADAMRRYLVARNSTLVWAVLSEKSAWNGLIHEGGLVSHQNGVYVLGNDGKISGRLTVRHNSLQTGDLV
jgi:hypothetical protein